MRTRHIVAFAAALLTLSGCATIQRHEAASTEQPLTREQQAEKDRIRDADGIPHGLWGPLDSVPVGDDPAQW